LRKTKIFPTFAKEKQNHASLQNKIMPYRRLPNTDAARIRALEIVSRQEYAMDISNIPFTLVIKQKIELFLPKYRTAIINSQVARDKQNVNSRKYTDYTRKARLYISHFLQVLNLSIIRGEIKPTARLFYGINENDTKLPPLASDQDLLDWGEKILKGEQERTRAGGTPIYSPSIALVKVNYENFRQAYFSQKQFQQNAARNSADVAHYRGDADALILDLWNEIETHFARHLLDEDERRARCEHLGIAYVFRKGEREKIRERQDINRITLRLPF
jgi:hypothetical protein